MLGWMAGAMMEEFLHSRLGDHWMFHQETGKILKHWWKQGDQYDLFQFLARNGLGFLLPDLMVKRWKAILS